MGTGGTLKGVARVLKKERPATKIVACEPDNSPILGLGIRQARNADSSPSESHPFFRPHLSRDGRLTSFRSSPRMPPMPN
jgi:cysteine synthase A